MTLRILFSFFFVFLATVDGQKIKTFSVKDQPEFVVLANGDQPQQTTAQFIELIAEHVTTLPSVKDKRLAVDLLTSETADDNKLLNASVDRPSIDKSLTEMIQLFNKSLELLDSDDEDNDNIGSNGNESTIYNNTLVLENDGNDNNNTIFDTYIDDSHYYSYGSKISGNTNNNNLNKSNSVSETVKINETLDRVKQLEQQPEQQHHQLMMQPRNHQKLEQQPHHRQASYQQITQPIKSAAGQHLIQILEIDGREKKPLIFGLQPASAPAITINTNTDSQYQQQAHQHQLHQQPQQQQVNETSRGTPATTTTDEGSSTPTVGPTSASGDSPLLSDSGVGLSTEQQMPDCNLTSALDLAMSMPIKDLLSELTQPNPNQQQAQSSQEPLTRLRSTLFKLLKHTETSYPKSTSKLPTHPPTIRLSTIRLPKTMSSPPTPKTAKSYTGTLINIPVYRDNHQHLQQHQQSLQPLLQSPIKYSRQVPNRPNSFSYPVTGSQDNKWKPVSSSGQPLLANQQPRNPTPLKFNYNYNQLGHSNQFLIQQEQPVREQPQQPPPYTSYNDFLMLGEGTNWPNPSVSPMGLPSYSASPFQNGQHGQPQDYGVKLSIDMSPMESVNWWQAHTAPNQLPNHFHHQQLSLPSTNHQTYVQPASYARPQEFRSFGSSSGSSYSADKTISYLTSLFRG